MTATDADFDTLAVGTLLVLATAQAPLLGVFLIGYLVVAAREPGSPISGFGNWSAIGAAGIRAIGLLAAVSLPAVAAFLGSGLLEPGSPIGVDTLESSPGALLAVVSVTSLAVAAWHCAVVGLVTLAIGGEGAVAAGLRLARSPAGYRLSLALGGVALSISVVAFGLTAIPLLGSALSAGVIFFGLAVAARLLSRVVADETSGRDRLATAVDSEPERYQMRRAAQRIGSDAPERAE